jgi:hypothetical protein
MKPDIDLIDDDFDDAPSPRQGGTHVAPAPTLDQRDGEVVTRRLGSNMPIDVKSKPIDRDFGAEFKRHESAQHKLGKPAEWVRKPADTSGFKLSDWKCACCAKAWRTFKVKQYCDDKCKAKGAPPPPVIKSFCQNCGNVFAPKRSDARYCGPTCQKAGARKLSRTFIAEPI